MTRRIRRSASYEISLLIKDENFIQPPTDNQRNALLNRSVKEFADHLELLHRQASDFVHGNLDIGLSADRTQRELNDAEIMEDWQRPVMQAMAEAVAGDGRDVLEVGFGRGISASMIQDIGVRSHTIIECNDFVVERFGAWRARYPDSEIHLSHGLWQDTLPDLGSFDAIFFHTYPLNEDEYLEYVHESITFAEHFFEHAAAHLRRGGVFTYFSNEIDSLSRPHQVALLQHFNSFSVSTVDLDLPENVMDTWWANKIAVVTATK